jgi:two-component system, LytTR family, sensor kinase
MVQRITEQIRASKKNFDVEMALVKSQINPHFLFNTINNIDILIEKDAPMASSYLNKLSDIMRFMLYETKSEQIPLQKEWAYLEKYIELQKIRMANPDAVRYSLEGNVENVFIAPMIFIPFVENAFKYAEGVKENKTIHIKILIQNGVISFCCENKYKKIAFAKNEFGGLGNDLIIKRLELLYPNKHTLEIKDENDLYQVKLQIQ